ncbi:glycosyltransferase family 4 protein [uncultured Chryseobacterium sp.]|uniref:glycosyltransferase family 4 protein n=1 Tax=uncultured Chryseobacterium sp. TaxID=259322 RepID=UPI002631C9B7|nr:glycosyltransferase family 4 protein [uncultured Chryseobacterium sp.]
MKKENKIAFLTPGRYNPMGVFSESYVNNIPDVKRYFGADIPIFPEGTSRRKQKYIRYLLTIFAFKSDRILNYYYGKILSYHLKKHNIDFVICEFLTTGASVNKVCEKLGIPMITNVLGHEINRQDYIDKYGKAYRKLAENKCSYIVPVAKNMIPKLQNFGFHNIVYSPIGAKPFFFEINPNYESFNLLAMGRFVKIKSPLDTIRAFEIVSKKFAEVKLNFVGEGALWDDAKSLAKQLGINNRINFMGGINQAEQCRLFQDTAIFLQHSVTAANGDSEGTPVVIIEASAAGLPVVSTKHAGILDVVVNGETGFLVNEHDYQGMAEKIIILLEDKKMLQKMGENGRVFIKNNFTAKHHTDTIIKIMESSKNA